MRKLTEMAFDALVNLFKNNGKLADLVSEKTAENVIFIYEEEYLYGLHYSYTWGSYYRNFAFHDGNTAIADHLEHMQNAFEFFSEENFKTVKRFIDLARRYENIGCGLSYEDDERLSGRVDELKEKVGNMIEDIMDADYSYADDPDCLADYVLTYPEEFEAYLEQDGVIYNAIA